MRRVTTALLAGALLLVSSGCAMLELVESRDFLGYKTRLSDTQKQYTRLVRWNEFARASEAVAPEQRGEFLAAMRALGEIRFTDYEAEAPVFDDLVESATVRVRYVAYHAETLAAVTYVEEQRWKREPGSADWRLDHEGPPLVASASVGAR